MITYKKGNLLNSNAEAFVNTVNTVGVMGKGIALMFKKQFHENFIAYKKACENKEVKIGKMFVTESQTTNPRWIINFPTKQHWRDFSKMEWIIDGLEDLSKVIQKNNIKSIAIPPLGAGNGGLLWDEVRQQIKSYMSKLDNIDIQLYEPTDDYYKTSQVSGSEKLTPARALIAELIRRYWILGFECSLLEIQKLAWFLERSLQLFNINSPLKTNFKAHYYGPYADNLRHLLNSMNGSFLCSEKNINDARPLDTIWFNNKNSYSLEKYLASTEMKPYKEVLEYTSKLIDGFESPFGMELLATVDWLIVRNNCEPETASILKGMENWDNKQAAKRKVRLFNEKAISTALVKLRIAHNKELV